MAMFADCLFGRSSMTNEESSRADAAADAAKAVRVVFLVGGVRTLVMLTAPREWRRVCR